MLSQGQQDVAHLKPFNYFITQINSFQSVDYKKRTKQNKKTTTNKQKWANHRDQHFTSSFYHVKKKSLAAVVFSEVGSFFPSRLLFPFNSGPGYSANFA